MSAPNTSSQRPRTPNKDMYVPAPFLSTLSEIYLQSLNYQENWHQPQAYNKIKFEMDSNFHLVIYIMHKLEVTNSETGIAI